ncbi:MAG: DNA polymerase I [Chlamydiota bacterium]
MSIDKLYLIDAVNFLFRSYYAISPMTNAKGESTHALYGFIRSLFKIMGELSPEHLVAVFDGKDNKKSRTDIFEGYKSHRKSMPQDLFPQLEKAIEFCNLAGIPNISVTGVEADDTIGSMATWAEKQGTKVYICTSDKDMCQLVSDHVFVINVHKENLLIDKKKVEEIYGVRPDQIVDYLAIVGDASDNIPGLEGFGPKTASALLQEFGTLDALLEHPEKVKGEKKQETLKTGKEVALMSRKLATINMNVDFPKEHTFFSLRTPLIEELKAFYQEMNFKTLLENLKTQTDSSPKKEEPVLYHLVDDELSLKTLVSQLLHVKEVGIDTETTDIRPMHACLVGIGLALKPCEAWYIPLNGSLKKHIVIEALKPLFHEHGPCFFGHHLKYDLHVLLNEGFYFPEISFDSMIASYLVAPEKMRHNLDDLSLEWFGKVKIPIEELIGKGKNQISMIDVPIEKVVPYCCADIDYTCRLKDVLEKELEEKGVTSLFNDIELPLIPVLLRMERRGIFVDIEKLSELSCDLNKRLSLLQEEIYVLAEETFNLNSPKQLSVILFEKLGIKPPKKTTTGYSTAADVLESLQNKHPIIKNILEYRTLEKLRSTYVDSLPNQILPKTGRIHCTFNQSVAATGRLSCQDPNLQNIPARSLEGRKIRSAFRPEKKGWSFLAADYSQIELRLLAHLSEDPLLLTAFNAGEDIHAFTASEVFGVPLDLVTKEMRHRAKAVNFGILYGQQAFGLSQGLDIDFKEAAAFIDTYFMRYKKVKEFLEFCKESARKTGRAVTMTGRQRPIPDIDSKNPMLRAAAERLAINTPLQGTAADLIKIAMIQIDELLEKEPDLGSMILQIHDELLFECQDLHIEALKPHVKKIMESAMKMKVPLLVDISIGKNWEEC